MEYSLDTDIVHWYNYGGYDDDYIGARIARLEIKIDPALIMYEDWPMADYILSISPPKARTCLIAWVSRRDHTFSAGQVIENQYLLAMNQFNVTSHSSLSNLAKQYRSGQGGDATNIMGILKPLLLKD